MAKISVKQNETTGDIGARVCFTYYSPTKGRGHSEGAMGLAMGRIVIPVGSMDSNRDFNPT